MNTLDDLRATLEAHVHEVDAHTALAPATRTAQVRARVRTARRRRTAAGAVVAAVAVLLAVGLAWLPGGPAPRPAPVGPTVLGLEVPETMTSLGWTYRLVEQVADGDEREISRGLDGDGVPRLLSWGTVGPAQGVVVKVPGEDDWRSTAADFADFVTLPATGGRDPLTVRAVQPGLVLAVYELDASVPPAGPSEHGVTFRGDPAGRTLIASEVGERGRIDLALEHTAPEGPLGIGMTCSGVPEDHAVNLSLGGGDADWAGPCRERWDPAHGADTVFTQDPGTEPGDVVPVRVWISRSIADAEPVGPDELPEARVAIGIYRFDQPTQAVPGGSVAHVVEERGHTWRLAAHVDSPLSTSLDLPGDGPWLVSHGWEADGMVMAGLWVDGRKVAEHSSDGDSVPGVHRATYVPPGASRVEVRLRRGAEGLDRVGVVVYELEE